MWDEIQKYAYKFTYCTFCAAEPGKWCETSTGREAQYLHGERTRPWQECLQAGYKQGQEDAADWYQRLGGVGKTA